MILFKRNFEKKNITYHITPIGGIMTWSLQSNFQDKVSKGVREV